MLPHGEAKYWTHWSTNLPDEPEEGQRWSLWSLSPSCWCKSGLTSLLVVADTALRTRRLDKQSRAYSISYFVRRLCPINLAGLHLDYILVDLVSVKLHLTPHTESIIQCSVMCSLQRWKVCLLSQSLCEAKETGTAVFASECSVAATQ